MAQQCPNCGEDNLRAKARFCDNCGTPLVGEADDGATRFAPEVEADLDAGLTRAMPEIETAEEEGLTVALSEAETLIEVRPLRATPGIETPDEGLTQFIPGVETLDDGLTRAVPGVEALEDGQTRAVPGLEALEDGLTQAIPAGETVRDLGATTAMTKAATTKRETGVATETVVQAKNVPPLVDRYQLTQVLGKGGFGAAYLAEDVKLKRRCVVKQMLAQRQSAKAMAIYRANFKREAELLAELNDPGHPNIPEIYDYFSDENSNYLVMKYIEGRNLKDALSQSEHKLPWREVVRYAIDVCSALNYMHTTGQQPIMHRDIKPANILLGDDGRVWLVDFGLAKANPIEGTGGSLDTRALGSLGYTPLEQWLGQATPASDIYALGATLHHLVTGISPTDVYAGEFHISKIQEQHGRFRPLRQTDRSLPKALEDIISRATAADPVQRPTALQLQQQLQVLVSGAQGAALYTFKNGKSAKTIGQLVDLCEQNRQEAQEYLYSGDFERWFLLINRNDLAEAVRQAIKLGKNQRDGLERFLKLILPNLFLRRLSKAGLHLAWGSVQFILSALIIIALLALAGSYVAGSFIQRSISSIDWNFHRLKLDEENRFSEVYLTRWFQDAIGVYFDELKVEVQAPDQFELQTVWNGYPLRVPANLRLGDKRPRFHIWGVNDLPLFWVADNLSAGINRGIDDVFERSPVDVSRLIVLDEAIVFNVVKSDDPGRPAYGTPTPTPTPIPTPTPTPTPVNITLVVIFNELSEDIILEIEDKTWEIAANDTLVLEIPPDDYNYRVTYKETGQLAAQGTKTWTLNKAYRLRIGLADVGSQGTE